LTEPTTVRITETSLPYFLPPLITAVSKVVKVELVGDSLCLPVTLQFPLTGVPTGTPIGRVGIYRWDGVQWSLVGGTRTADGTGIQGSVAEFSMFVLGTGPSLHKPVEFNPHMNSNNPVVSIRQYRLAHPELDAPPGQSVVVFRRAIVINEARMILPQGSYSFCYDWEEGRVDAQGNLIYYHAFIGELPDHPAVSLNEDSNDLVPPVLNLYSDPAGLGLCDSRPLAVGGNNAVPPGQATAQNFVGVFNLLDPNRTFAQYHGTVTFNLNGTFTSSEFLEGSSTPLQGQGVWTWTQATQVMALTWQPGGTCQGVITGNTNDFTIRVVWANGGTGQLRFFR
jgi:hypothetical protein